MIGCEKTWRKKQTNNANKNQKSKQTKKQCRKQKESKKRVNQKMKSCFSELVYQL